MPGEQEKSGLAKFFGGFSRGMGNYKSGNFNIEKDSEDEESDSSDSSFADALSLRKKKKKKKTGYGLIDSLQDRSGVDDPGENLNQNVKKLYFDKQKQ